MSKAILAALLAAAAAVGFATSGLATGLGAHPFWAGSVPLMGLIAALPLFVIGLRWPLAGALAAGALTLAAMAAARFGKAAFAASYAENTLAGHFWFLGWIVLSGAATALIAMGILALLRRGSAA